MFDIAILPFFDHIPAKYPWWYTIHTHFYIFIGIKMLYRMGIYVAAKDYLRDVEVQARSDKRSAEVNAVNMRFCTLNMRFCTLKCDFVPSM